MSKFIVSGKDNRRLDGQLEIFESKTEAGDYLIAESGRPWDDATAEQVYEYHARTYFGGRDRYWHVEEVPDEQASERMAELSASVFDR